MNPKSRNYFKNVDLNRAKRLTQRGHSYQVPARNCNLIKIAQRTWNKFEYFVKLSQVLHPESIKVGNIDQFGDFE